MRALVLALAALAGSVSSAWAAASPDLRALFGPRVQPVSGAGCLTGDFDGDGAADFACLVRIGPGAGRFPPGVTVTTGLFGAGAGPRSGATALAIVQKGGRQAILISDDGGYFDTPIWKARLPPIRLAPRGSKAFRDFHRQSPRIANDILVLGTEAGIDTALYWDGRRFRLFSPNEEP